MPALRCAPGRHEAPPHRAQSFARSARSWADPRAVHRHPSADELLLSPLRTGGGATRADHGILSGRPVCVAYFQRRSSAVVSLRRVRREAVVDPYLRVDDLRVSFTTTD